MNRGAHEGESGVALYYFDASVSSVEECLFVDTKQNYELLKKDVDSVSYVSSDRNRFYLCVEGSIYGITLDTRQINTVAENLRSDCYVSVSYTHLDVYKRQSVGRRIWPGPGSG